MGEKSKKARYSQALEYHQVLLCLAKSCFLNLEAALEEVTQVDAQTLGVERVSVWLFNRERTAIVCEDLYQRHSGAHQKGQIFWKQQYPKYFSALEESRTLAVRDARFDLRTSEFRADYLIPHGISSMLDVPIWVHGEFVGIICHEQVGPIREWSTEEMDFVGSIADMVSFTLVSIQRRKAEQALRQAHDRLEIRVKERTAELAQANELLKIEIAQRKKFEEKLAFLASHDGLTGLSNRSHFEKRLKEAMKRCQRSGEKFALLLMDLDYFKVINDTHGHPAGDRVLREVALRLQRQSRESDTVARLGGDEFIILLTPIQGREEVRRFMEQIKFALRDPIPLEDTQHCVTVSMGVVLYPEDGEEIKILMSRADLALYDAKHLGRDALQFYQKILTRHASHSI
jgi:diguanylate cyclase (GGDEF)-like protein